MLLFEVLPTNRSRSRSRGTEKSGGNAAASGRTIRGARASDAEDATAEVATTAGETTTIASDRASRAVARAKKMARRGAIDDATNARATSTREFHDNLVFVAVSARVVGPDDTTTRARSSAALGARHRSRMRSHAEG